MQDSLFGSAYFYTPISSEAPEHAPLINQMTWGAKIKECDRNWLSTEAKTIHLINNVYYCIGEMIEVLILWQRDDPSASNVRGRNNGEGDS